MEGSCSSGFLLQTGAEQYFVVVMDWEFGCHNLLSEVVLSEEHCESVLLIQYPVAQGTGVG